MPEGSAVERKLSSLQNWVVFGLGFILAFAVSFVVYAAWQNSTASNDRQAARLVFCVELEKVRTYARDSGVKTLREADTPGTATYNFLKQHPEFTNAVHTSAQHTIDTFSPPLRCKDYAEGRITTPSGG